MKKITLHRFTLLFSLVFSFGFILQLPLWSNGYEIQIKITGVADTNVILAHYLNKSIYPDDTIRVNAKGTGVFKGKNYLPQGMYVIYLPDGKYFELIMGQDQRFTLSTDTANFAKYTRIDGSADNTVFFSFQEYMLQKRELLQQYQSIIKGSSNEKEKLTARTSIDSLTNEHKLKIQKIIKENPGLFVSTFLRATLDVDVPDHPVNPIDSVDPSWQYKYYKTHYFDNFNSADVRLLHTPLYEDKIMNYLGKVIPQIPDSIIREADRLLDQVHSDSTLFRYLLVTLFNYYGNSNIMGMDAVQVNLAEKYYLTQAWWIDDKFKDELEERVKALKPLILGNTAPNVELLIVPSEHFIAAENDSTLKKYPHVGALKKLYDIQADYLVLIFWEATCSHCKKVVPDMYQIFKDKLEPEGVKVLAISTLFGEEGKVKWVDFVNNNKLYDWINAWNPYDYQYKITYDIRSTPQIFILDKDKKIIGKRISPEQVSELIDMYKKQFGE
jgi:hypothetical protein